MFNYPSNILAESALGVLLGIRVLICSVVFSLDV